MSKAWMVTGSPGVGKSTVVSKVVRRLMSAGIIVGGCTTLERRVRGVRVGFEVKNLGTGETGELASAEGRLGPKVGRYRVNLADLKRVGASGLNSAAEGAEVIVMDELGPMELVSPEFRKAVSVCMASGKPILAVVHERLDDDLIAALREEAEAYLVITSENRDGAADELYAALLKAAGGPRLG